jgi:dihydroflavonol-4-reductase
MSTVLVTGGSGFVGAHIVLRLLAQNHKVRTTVRNPARKLDVLAMLAAGGAPAGADIAFYTADLNDDAGWNRAVEGCDYVMHVASPLPPHVPKDENELILPAREGTLRVLCAARDCGVKRVVLTSSFAAIGYGHKPRLEPFDESDWTDLGGADVQPYVRSKALAERAAWDFIAREGGKLELAAINPVAILGPVLGGDFSASIAIVAALLNGSVPVAPKIHFGVVDVRDVADLHLRAMTDPAAGGERFLAVAGEPLSILDIAQVLRQQLGARARRVPRFEVPDWLVRLAARPIPRLRDAVPLLGKVRRASSAKAMTRLGWTPRAVDETIVATAESLLRFSLVNP